MKTKTRMMLLATAALAWDLIGIYVMYLVYMNVVQLTSNVGLGIVAVATMVYMFIAIEMMLITRWVRRGVIRMPRLPIMRLHVTVEDTNDDDDDYYDEDYDDYEEEEEEEEEDQTTPGDGWGM